MDSKSSPGLTPRTLTNALFSFSVDEISMRDPCALLRFRSSTIVAENGSKNDLYVDATISHAPGSTKNREPKRDPEMRQTKKGNQRYFGIKEHVGVDSKRKIIHSAMLRS